MKPSLVFFFVLILIPNFFPSSVFPSIQVSSLQSTCRRFLDCNSKHNPPMKESKDKQMYKRERNRWLVWLVDGDLLEKVMDALGYVEGGAVAF